MAINNVEIDDQTVEKATNWMLIKRARYVDAVSKRERERGGGGT